MHTLALFLKFTGNSKAYNTSKVSSVSVFLASAETVHCSGPDQKHITSAQSSESCDPDC